MARRHNLPAQPTPLLAREGDILAVARRLQFEEVRLLTLTGPGGVGKTRLALAVAEALLHDFPDGAWFIDLASLDDASLVVSALASTLGVHQITDLPLLDSLCDHLRDRRALLVLDNVEHLLDAIPDLTRLLQACPDVKLLVTSRAVLRSRWEHVYVVPPLDLSGAVSLFGQRALARVPDVELTDRDGVADLCARLDGLPLAIELAAARCTVLSPREMLTRLPDRLDLLIGGAPDQPVRHRTLRDAISWSYELLTPSEKALFRRLSPFAGGFDVDAATRVAATDGQATTSVHASSPDSSRSSPLDTLDTLVGASLVRRDPSLGGEQRFRLLETIRAYALEQVTAEGELDQVRRLHADHYLALAVDLGGRLNGSEQIAALDRLQREHDNLRVVLRWALEVGAAEHGLRVAGAIGWFWWVRGHLSEGRDWLTRLLALPGAEAPTLTRAGALDAAGFLAFQQGACVEALGLHNEALAIREAAGDGMGLRESLHGLGDAHLFSGGHNVAREQYERGLANAEALGDTWGQALFGFHIGLVTAIQHGAAASHAQYERALALSRASGNAWGVAYSAGGLGRATLAKGNVSTADALFRETLRRITEVDDQFAISIRLSDLGTVAAARGDWERVLRLEGASAALREARGFGTFFVAPADVDARIARARQTLQPHVHASAWADGVAMSLDEAVAYALAPDEATMALSRTAVATASPLSPREREVAALIGRGLTNRQIGEALVITEGTARIHVAHVLAKLDLRSRVQVAAWAAERGLLGAPSPTCE